jgi:hypothetical protein
MSEYRERLEAFYRHYAPDKVASVDVALEAYKGREDQMFKALERKYGPETAVPGYQGANGTDQKEEEAPKKPEIPTLNFNPHRPRLIRFYEKWAPEKLSSVDSVLQVYAGREALMFEALVKKYGPEPSTEEAADSQPAGGKKVKINEVANESVASDHQDGEEGTPKKDSAERDGNSPTGEGEGSASPPASKTPPPDPIEVYKAALQSVGYASNDLPILLNVYGPKKECYAAAVAILMKVIGDEALFDVTTTTLQFPDSQRFPKQKEGWDELAFDHIVAYRTTFLQWYQESVDLRDEESRERAVILHQLKAILKKNEYGQLVRREALRLIIPIEEERRATIADDERLRFKGLLNWFSQKKAEILMSEEMPMELLIEVESKWERFKEVTKSLSIETKHQERLQKQRSGGRIEEWQRMAAVSSFSSPDPARPWLSPSRTVKASASKATPTVTPSKPANRGPWKPSGSNNRGPSVSTTTGQSDRTASVNTHSSLPSTLSQSRPQTLERLKRHPLNSQRAKKVVAPGIFSALKYVAPTVHGSHMDPSLH